MATYAIVGHRDFTDYRLFRSFVDQYEMDISCIVSGGARGADTLAERYAKECNIPFILHPALWDVYGKSAGPRRNKLIVADADKMIAFLAPGSRGTANSISLARQKGIPVYICPV